MLTNHLETVTGIEAGYPGSKVEERNRDLRELSYSNGFVTEPAGRLRGDS